MATIANTSDSAALNAALDQEFVKNFQGDATRLMEILGIFGVETVAAGTTLKMLKVTGALNNSKTDASKADGTGTGAVTLGSSSGTAYIEGDEVALSKFSAAYESVGEVTARPYRKMTTAAAIQKSGYVNAVLKTDQKMESLLYADVVSQFFTFLATGTGTATGKGLQACAANVDATLGDTLETNGDSTSRIIHFVSRQDAAEYIGGATITDQSAFGLTYLENFVGLTNVFLTNKVAKGTMYATPAENLHLFGVDFSALAQAGLPYATDADGLIGIAHTPAYDRVSVETNVLTGCTIFPEVKDYIVKGTISAK
ncbi:hypothetical protein [uncultured Parolsenella sp.]|uniref:hypothetical protein n=1 Tax=uncultured Parolsenella sp. TaxID=2083008 RepID=UPI0025CC8329|nr:hypothetical protein [uncultured Parolsenella sp.]